MPQLTGDYVRRPRLQKQLDAARARKLTLISAPAGYGKTTLLASWLSQQEETVIWLELDDLDNDLVRLMAYLVMGATEAEPDGFTQSTALLFSESNVSTEQWVAAIVDDFLTVGRTIYLALDDLHLIQDQSVQRFLQLLIDNQPPNLHLLLAARSDPLLALARLRVANEVVEIRVDDLRFSTDEVAQFLTTALSSEIETGALEEVTRVTAGWIASLRLLVLAAERGDRDQLQIEQVVEQARDHSIDFLISEVLGRQPPRIREFLLISALFERFHVELQAELLQWSAAECHAIVTLLVQSNLFIVTLDQTEGWYRYHHLFQAALRAQSAHDYSDAALAALYRQAATWFAGRGLIDEAVRTALSANDLEHAVALIEANTHNLLNRIERRHLEDWLAKLPDSIVWNRPILLVAKVWLYYRHWRIDELTPLLARLEQLSAQTNSTNDAQTRSPGEQNALADIAMDVSGHTYTLQSFVDLLYRGNLRSIIEKSNAAVNALRPNERGERAIAIDTGAIAHYMQGEIDSAFALVDQALIDASPHGPAKAQLYLGRSALCELAGDFPAMQKTVTRFIAATETDQQPSAGARWMAGRLNYEWNQLDRAFENFSVTVAYHRSTNFIAACTSMVGLARIHLLLGDFDAAHAAISLANTEATRVRNKLLGPLIEGVQADLAIWTGRREEARQWAHSLRIERHPLGPAFLDSPLLVWARICLLLKDPTLMEKAERELRRGLAELAGVHLPYRATQYRILLAACDEARGDRTAAVATLNEALAVIRTGGLVRSVLDYGIGLEPLLSELDLPSALRGALSETATGANVQASNAAESMDVTVASVHGASNSAIDLTHREQEILCLMQQGFTNQEIADELVIALNTVKRHASNIFQKLAVDNRRQAVRLAVNLGILLPQR